MKRFVLTVLAVFLVGVIGVILPPQIMKWQDERRTMESSLEETQEILLAPQPAMSITEKLDLYKKMDTGVMWLASGKNYDEKSILKKTEEELEKLRELEILEVDTKEISYKEIQAILFVDTQDSVHSMIVWNILLIQEETGVQLRISLDDETGKILEISQLELDYDYTEFKDVGISKTGGVVTIERELEKITERWDEYLGLF